MGADTPRLNPTTTTPFESIVEKRYSRRGLLGLAAKAGMLAAMASAVKPAEVLAQATENAAPALTFKEIAKSTAATHHVARGYRTQIFLRWGDAITHRAPAFNSRKQNAKAQLQQFGYNNDFLAYLPIDPASENSKHGLLCSNHEYTSTYLMFPGLEMKTAADSITKAQADVELAAHGHGTVEIKKGANGQWQPVLDSRLNRRMNPLETEISIGGPAAGHPRMRTKADPQASTVIGTFGNCAGGVTPWRSVLVSEENFNYYFAGDPKTTGEASNHARYGVADQTWYGWHRFYDRFNVNHEPNEPNRFGWVVEYDPYDPERKPVKRTALGRTKHESATTTLTPDGRVVVYTGDDERFEYIYRFVSDGKYNPADRKANFGLLDSGILSVAKFHENGSLEWLPLVYGQGALTSTYGFNSQADVLIETRRAADVLGATPMDRPEGIAAHPHTGQVFISLTNNNKREEGNAANTRINNIHGHIVELLPPKLDHAADRFEWSIFLRGGNPEETGDDALYGSAVSEHGWLSCPDNLTLDPDGHLWIATDGQPKSIGFNDGLYAAETQGERYGASKLFFTGPEGCEITGPAFTPDGTTLFVAVQHPGDGKGATFDNPSNRWPDFNNDLPPRPSVVAITRQDGGKIGS